MPSIINASSTGSGGIVQTADASGVLQLQSNGTTALTVNTDGSTTFAQGANLPNTFGFKNRIINGAMGIWQRGTSFSVPASGSITYTADRWGVSPAGNTVTVNQGGAPAGFPQTSLNINGAASVTNINIQQRIEAVNCVDLASTTVTVSGYVFQSTGSAKTGYTVRLIRPTTTADTWSAVTQVGSTYTIPSIASGSFVYFSCTFTTDSSSTLGLGIFIDTNSAVVGGQAVAISGIQLEKGTQATSFDFRSYGTELALCQRYLPVIQGNGSYVTYGYTGLSQSTIASYFVFTPIVQPRVAPTGIVATAASGFTSSDGGANITLTSIIFVTGSTTQVLISGAASGVTQYRPSLLGVGATSQIQFTGCEL
jgi:hypothetical protein